jgi:hypothetical protein
MTKAELRALAQQAITQKEVVKVAEAPRKSNQELVKTEAERFFERVGKLKEKKEVQRTRRWEREMCDREGVTVVTDHCGREFYKNEAGEWL